MLPVVRIAAAAVSYDASIPDLYGAAVLPAGVRPGDHVFILMAFASSTIAVDDGATTAAGWTEFLNITVGDNRLIVYRLIVDEDTDLETGPDFGFTETDVKGAAVVLAYRSLEAAGEPVDSDITAPSGGDSAGTFTLPDLDLVRFSDLYLGVVFYPGDDDIAFAGLTEIARSAADGGNGDGTLLVVEVSSVAVETVGGDTVGYEGSGEAEVGFAAAFVLASPAVDVAPMFALDPPGTIGLPVKGI